MTAAERIHAEREAQGLDPTVTDAAALARIAAVVSAVVENAKPAVFTTGLATGLRADPVSRPHLSDHVGDGKRHDAE